MSFCAAVQRINFFFSLSITLYRLPRMLVNKVDHYLTGSSLTRFGFLTDTLISDYLISAAND